MKKIFKILSIAAICLSLTGCIKVSVNMNIQKDGTIDVELKELVDEELMKSLDEDWKPEDLVDDSEDSSLDLENEKQEVVSEKISGKTWSGIKYTGTYSKEDAAKILTNKNGKMTLTLTLSDEDATSGDAESSDDSFIDEDTVTQIASYASYGAEMKATITMPADIKCNVESDAIQIDKNTATIDFLKLYDDDSLETNKIELSCSTVNYIPYICAGCAVVVVIAGLFIYKKKKSK